MEELYSVQKGNSLSHHGILGQKWGKKNGPPYPLDYKKLSAEERELAKADAIRRGDVKEANFNRRYFSDQEVKAVMERFNLNGKLKDLDESTQHSRLDKAEVWVSNVKRTADVVDKGTDAWNIFAKTANGLGVRPPLIVIDKRNPWDVKKDSDKDNVTYEYTYNPATGKYSQYKKVITRGDGTKLTYVDPRWNPQQKKNNNKDDDDDD